MVRTSVEGETEERVTLRFSVRDQGIGIPEDKREKLFQPFEQVDGSLTRRFGGTGLGLSIVKQLVGLMGGEVGLESQVGEGSEFWFTALLGKQEAHLALAGDQLEGLEGKRILVVDDNRISRLHLSELISGWGCRGDEAVDGPSALSKLRLAQADGNPFDLAIVDMQMPGMDGETLQGRIASDPNLEGGPPLVLLTSVAFPGEAARLAAAGFAGYLTKPVRKAHLHDVLTSVINPPPSRAPRGEPAIVTRHTAAEERKARSRILLVEDNPTNLKVATMMLGNLGYPVETAENGLEAVRRLESEDFSLVLMDVQMPVMDGYEATGMIRDPSSPVRSHGIPIIAMTAHALAEDQGKCLDSGMNDFISKPVRTQALSEILAKWLDADRPGIDPREAEVDTGRSPTPADPVVWDRAALVERMDGDEDSAREVMEIFLVDMPIQVRKLSDGLLEVGSDQAGRLAHSIKGAAGSVGADALAGAAEELERTAKGASPEEKSLAFGRVESEFLRLRALAAGEWH